MEKGIELIAAERRRQIEKLGYDDEHDSCEGAFQLSTAAAHYIANAINKDFENHTHNDGNGNVARFQIRSLDEEDSVWSEVWPWLDFDNRHKTDVIRSLVKAGALIAAEIDRLQNQ